MEQSNKHIATVTLHFDEMSNKRRERKTVWDRVSWISRNAYPFDVRHTWLAPIHSTTERTKTGETSLGVRG